jgi:predicted RNA-binding protein with PIN domain
VRYLIDGYNLAHALGGLEGRVGPAGLERARKRLLDHLAAAHGGAAGEVTIVFDARGARRLGAQEVVGGLDVRYALDEEADDLIERLVRAHSAPKQLAVVSDDRRVQAAARRRGGTPLGCQAYLDLLDRLQAARPAPDVPPEKPGEITAEETAEWERRFAAGSRRLPGRHDRRN